uniref:Resistance to inhibitors of cholinesterase protein 3 N-terminal domain-containing protein n=1 Tax=Anopheles farauti TaxID=69004 RepID=A0A182Q1C2_9DIPT
MCTATATMATTAGHRMESNSGMGPRKTMIIMVTVVGCVAILWPKVFYPMMVGNGQNKNVIKDHRGAGCCGVVLDQETFANASINYAASQQQQEQQKNLFRKRNFAPYVDIDSIRQERPPHLRPEAMHPAMRERGRAIPQSGSIHGGDRPQTPPRIVEGRPGPIPGMRPPMGAGSHQATKSANSMGFIMPLYTIGIVSFFIYTIMKLIFKKTPATPYAEVKPDPAFRNEVFTTEQYIKRPDDGTTKLDQSHATAATNGELVVPVAVSLVNSASTVQTELSIDYEHLASQKETARPAEIVAAETIVTPEQESAHEKPPSVQDETNEPIEAAAYEERAEELPSEQQPPHDPTTEKVVDGIVVKKVVSLVESANLPSESAAVEEAVEIAVHERSATNGELSSVDDSVTEAPENLVNPQIEKESDMEQVAIEEPGVEQQLSVQEDVAEPEIEEVMDVKQVSVQSSVNVPSAGDANATGLDEPDAAVQETTYTMDSEPVHKTAEALVVENLHNEIILESDQSEQLVEAAIATAVQEDANAKKEEDIVTIESIDETREPVKVEENSNQQGNEQDFGQEPVNSVNFTGTEHTEVVVSEENTTTLELSSPNAKEEQKSEAGFGQVTDQVESVAEEVIEIVEKQAETAGEVTPEEISSNDKTPTLNDSQAEELIDEKHIVEQQHSPLQEEVPVRKALDPETSALVHETVQDITLAAEQLVQEVLEHAEELAKQQEEQHPEPPAYDPATQKLVDGIVINRFEDVESKKSETVEAAIQEDVSDAKEEERDNVEQEQMAGEEEPAATVHALIEEDGAELDSISEDTSLSVASVIEQLPAPKVSDESAITVQTVMTTDAMIDSTSSELTFDEQPATSQPDTETEVELSEPVLEIVEQAIESIASAPESTDSFVVIDQQPLAKESDEQNTLSEALITTTEVMTSTSTSSEPVFVETNDQPTVETETMLEGTDKADVAGNLPGAAAADTHAARSVSIEEVHDDAAIVDGVEGKVIEEHIVPISVEKASSSDTMTITEVTGEEASSGPSEAAPPVVMDTIDEKPEPVELHDQEKQSSQISPTTLEHVTKEALVERALNEAAAVVNEIESIVDHIITEKLIHSGATEGQALDTVTVREVGAAPQEPPRLAASAAQVVEAFESKSASVHGMVSSSDSTPNTQTITVTNGLTTNLDEPIGDTNPPASELSLPTDTPRSFTPASTPASSEPSPVPVPTLGSSESSSAASAASLGSVSETHTIHFVADQQPLPPRTTTTGGAADTLVNGVHDDGSALRTSVESSPADAAPRIGQVPTSVSNVTNPKFLTLNLANYSTSDSSGNNSKSSSLSIANLSQSGASLAGGDSADQLMELELLRKKLDETERAMTKIIANMGNIPKGQESNVNADEPDATGRETGTESQEDPAKLANGHAGKPTDVATESESEKSEKETTGGEASSAGSTPEKKPKKRDTSTERGTVKVMAMEVTAQRENGKRLSRPSTPLLPLGGHSETAHAPAEEHETRSIVLDGRLPHDSKILVSDAETAVEKMEPENSEEEDDAPVILSGKMTLSLINMDYIERDATGSVAVGEIVTELHKPKAELTTASSKAEE